MNLSVALFLRVLAPLVGLPHGVAQCLPPLVRGEFVLESAGQDQALSTVTYIPYPETLYLEVCQMLFPGGNDSDD